MCGCVVVVDNPPDNLLKEAKNTSKFFKCIGNVHNAGDGEVSFDGKSAYQALTVEEYEAVSVQILVLEGRGKSIDKWKYIALYDLPLQSLKI